MTNSLRRAVLAGCVLGLFAADALAAGQEERVWRQVETVRIWKLTEMLDLDQERIAAMMPILNEYTQELREQGRERDEGLRELSRLAKSDSTDEKQIRAAVDKVLKSERGILDLRHKHYRKMEDVLSPDQLAKYMIFDARFHDEIHQMLDDMRRHKRLRHRERILAPDGGGQAVPP
ncbi:periplasmic heavy metal sensor, partial [bacterium]|nr:periplasmic heavy metal sensor [bacterium]